MMKIFYNFLKKLFLSSIILIASICTGCCTSNSIKDTEIDQLKTYWSKIQPLYINYIQKDTTLTVRQKTTYLNFSRNLSNLLKQINNNK